MFRLLAAVAAVLAAVGLVSVVAPPAGAAPAASPKVQLPSTARPWQTGKSGKTVHVPVTPAPVTKPWAVSKNGEIPALRTAKSSTFAQRNGQLKTVVSTVPTHYRDKSGTWVNIDDTLTKNAHGGFSPTADGFTVSLPSDLSDPLSASSDGASVSASLPGAKPVAATTAGSSATYANAFPHTNVVLTVEPNTVKEQFVLTTPDAPTSYAEQVTVGTGQSLRPNKARGIDILDSFGSVVGQIPAPVMTDSSHHASTNTSTGVHYEISGPARPTP